MTDIQLIKKLQRLTNAGLGDCKNALVASNGDLFSAATSMLTEDDVLQIQQSVRVRAMAGDSIKDPVSSDEQQLVDDLVAHFVSLRTRPLNVGFLFELTRLFLSDASFLTAFVQSPTDTIREYQRRIQSMGEFDGISNISTCSDGKFTGTVISMPVSGSEWECDFIVLQHPRKKLFGNSRQRLFAVYKRTKRVDHGIANIEEMGIEGEDVSSTRRWVHPDLEFSPETLAGIGYDSGLQECG